MAIYCTIEKVAVYEDGEGSGSLQPFLASLMHNPIELGEEETANVFAQ